MSFFFVNNDTQVNGKRVTRFSKMFFFFGFQTNGYCNSLALAAYFFNDNIYNNTGRLYTLSVVVVTVRRTSPKSLELCSFHNNDANMNLFM